MLPKLINLNVFILINFFLVAISQLRYQDKTLFPLSKSSNSTLFISITSGPNHGHLRNIIRTTWLLPCMAVDYCDYRFFIDASNQTEGLIKENDLHEDIVFRNSCSLMDKYPHKMNYGNSHDSAAFKHKHRLE